MIEYMVTANKFKMGQKSNGKLYEHTKTITFYLSDPQLAIPASIQAND